MKTWSALFILALLPTLALATEVDNFTDRDMPLSDSREPLNRKMNLLITSTMDQINAKYDCAVDQKKAQEKFYQALDKKIGGFFWAKFESEIEKDPTIDKRSIKRKNSVYRSLNMVQAFALRLASLGSVVNIGGHQVGTDKIGHFIGVGKIYFDLMRTKKASLQKAMEYGVNSEETFFGLQTTGVYSYGDLVANYEGLLFWQNLFGSNDPYLYCQEGKLFQVRSFDWPDYVNEAWDEAINCSAFRTEAIQELVVAEAHATCPLAPLRPETITKYSFLPLPILNLQGQ